MHHCIADGIALAQVMLSLTDDEPGEPGEPARRRRRHRDPPEPGLLLGAAMSAAGLSILAIREGRKLLTSPRYAYRRATAAAGDASTAVRLVLAPGDRPSAIKADPAISRRVAWTSPLMLAEIKEMAHANDVTINDIMLAAVSGALRHYLHGRHSPAPEIQAMVPFNLRPLDEPVPRDLGNRFGLVFLPLPVGTKGSSHRLQEVHRRMNDIKVSRDGPVSFELLSLSGLAPEAVEQRMVGLFSGKGTAVMTNVPGPTDPVYLAGVPVRSVLVWAPTSGHIGMSVSIFSYRGEVTVGFMTDAVLLPDPQELADEVERELSKFEVVPG
jgi:WS/DGAT/MGAT family acyltransferase